MQAARRKGKVNQAPMQVLLVMLAALFALSSFNLPEFHGHEEVEIHTPETEQDPCHVSVFHAVDRSCGHETHFSAKDSCPACDLACPREIELMTWLFAVAQTSPVNEITAGSDEAPTSPFIHLKSRAPPAA